MRFSRRARAAAPLLAVPLVLSACGWASETAAPAPTGEPTASSSPKAKKSKKAEASPSATASAGASVTPQAAVTTMTGKASDQRKLKLARSIGGAISPKSVVASRTGLVFAQNMMYRHSVTVYSKDGELVKTIPDGVKLSSFGVDGHSGTSKGAPVEAAFSHDGEYAYVSNYSMYGNGFGPEGSDTCTPSSARAAGVSDSYVYRVDVASLTIDKV